MAKKQHVGLHRSEEIAIVALQFQKTVADIAKELGLSEHAVQSYIENNPANTTVVAKKLIYDIDKQVWTDGLGNYFEGPPVTSEDTKESIAIKTSIASGVKAKDFFARDKSGRATVMTEGASSMSDLTKTRTKRDNSKCTHRISQPK